MQYEIEKYIGQPRRVNCTRHYYDCPQCKVKDGTGTLVVEWDKDKFVCNHMNSCGYKGTISKTLAYDAGIRQNNTQHKPMEDFYKPKEQKPTYSIGEVQPFRHKVDKSEDYNPRNDRVQQLTAMFKPEDKLVACIDANYGMPVEMTMAELKDAEGNYTHIKVNAGGSKAEDIADLRYTLIECDEIADPQVQAAYIRQLSLPVVTVTWSGNKSIHAVVKVDAADLAEYESRVDLLHEVCNGVGFKVDNTKDCCRYTRLAGGINTKSELKEPKRIQRLLEGKTGATNWQEWEQKYLPKLIVTENVKDSSEIEAKNVKPGFSSGFATHDYNDSGMKGGDLVLLTGRRNQGKTTFSRQMVIAAAKQKIKSMVWYAEADEALEKGYLVRLVATSDEVDKMDNGYGRTTWLATKEAQDRFNQEYQNYISMYIKPLALDVPVFTDLLCRMREQAKLGVRLFVIDNMMKLTTDQANTLDAQKRIIADLKEFAVRSDTVIVLICHPRKGDGDQSISGAQEQENTADTILRFSRCDGVPASQKDFPQQDSAKVTAKVVCDKIRNGGTMHPMYFEFDHERQANIEVVYLPDIKWSADQYMKDGFFSRSPTLTPALDSENPF